jgi:hypothetical protein
MILTMRKKLVLKLESTRNLATLDLARVIGGNIPQTRAIQCDNDTNQCTHPCGPR